MQTKIQQLKKNLHLETVSNKQLAIVGGVLGVGLVAFVISKVFFNKKSTNATTLQFHQQEKSFQQTYKQVINSVQQVLDRNKVLNGEVIKSILKNQYKLAKQQFKTTKTRLRNQRRKVMKDRHQYSRVVLSIDAQKQQLMDKHLNAILAHFNIDKTRWIEVVDMWSTQTQQNKQQWENMLVQLDNELLDSLRDPKKRPLPLKKLQEIFQFKIHTLKNLNQSGLDLDSSTSSEEQNDLNAKYTLIDKYITDLVFIKFGAQQQDINFSQSRLPTQQEKDKYETIYDQYTELLRIQIFGDESIQDQEESQHSAPANRIGAVQVDQIQGQAGDQDQDQGQYY